MSIQKKRDLPIYAKCRYSLFISYAHADDKGNNWWISSLKEAIWNRLDQLPREIGKLELHISGENGPSVGHLGDELKERVRQSFGMLLVVGSKYVTSDWCEKELKLFCDVFGLEGTKTRLFIAVMSEEALIQAQKGEYWRKIVAEDQLWVPMYQDSDPNSPLKHRLDNGAFTDAFFQKAKLIADPLIENIKRDFGKSKKDSQATGAIARELPPTPWSGAASQHLRVAIGPCTESLAGKAELLKSALEQAGAEVTVLNRRLIDDYDPDDGTPLRPALEQVDVLVVPITYAKPLRPDVDGGHTTILAQQWKALNKTRSIVWYRPADVEFKSDETAHPRHLGRFNELAPICASEQAVANLLFGVGAGSAIKVYIEKLQNTAAFELLASELEVAWNALEIGDDRPRLKCRTLDLHHLDSAPKDDVAGVVLLLPLNLKRTESLRDQIKQVEELIDKEGAAYPGVVALLFQPPPPESIPEHEWPYVHFRRDNKELALVLEEDSKPDLDAFLLNIWRRYKKSRAMPAIARPTQFSGAPVLS